jgi:hypothetical protein
MTAAKFLVVALCVIGVVAGFNFVVDPLQIFHPARFYRPVYPSEERMHNAGLIRSQTFDTVFMGDSIALHVRSSEVDEHLGTHTVKLVMSGAASREQNFVLGIALTRHPRRVLWEMNDMTFVDSPEIDTLPYLPADLYRKNLKGMAGYLFNLETGREAVWSILRSWKPLRRLSYALLRAGYIKYDNDDPNELNTFDPALVASSYNAKRSLAAYKYYSVPGNGQRFSVGYSYDALVRNFERDAFQFIQGHPDTNFTIYFPPFSMVQYAAMRDFGAPDMLSTFYRFSAYALQRLAQLQNVSVFDFRDDSDISHNLDNFADAIHHSPAIGVLLLSRIAKGENRVEKADPARSIERLKRQIDAYTLPQ